MQLQNRAFLWKFSMLHNNEIPFSPVDLLRVRFFCQILLKTVTNAKTYFFQILIAVILILESNKNYNVNSRTLRDDCPISLLSKAAHVWWKVVKRLDRHLIFVVINDLPFSIWVEFSFVGEDEWILSPWFW